MLEEFIATHDDELKGRWIQYLKYNGDIFLVWKNVDKEGAGPGAMFNTFERIESLVGSHVEAYARQIGDVDDEEWAARKVLKVDRAEVVDCHDQTFMVEKLGDGSEGEELVAE